MKLIVQDTKFLIQEVVFIESRGEREREENLKNNIIK